MLLFAKKNDKNKKNFNVILQTPDMSNRREMTSHFLFLTESYSFIRFVFTHGDKKEKRGYTVQFSSHILVN